MTIERTDRPDRADRTDRTVRTDRTDRSGVGRSRDQVPARRRPVAGERSRARRAPDPAQDPRRTPAPAPQAAPVTSTHDGVDGDHRGARRRRHLLPRAGRVAAAPTDQRPPRERRSGRLPAGVRRVSPLTAVLAVLALLAVAGAGLLWTRVRDDRSTEAARTAALDAAVSAAPVVLSYDSAHLDQDFAVAEQRLTGSFKAQYATTTATVVKPTAAQVKAKVNADVVAASVVSARPDQVVVLLFVDQTTTSTKVQGPRRDLNRVRMTLVRVQGEWKVSGIAAL